jgi:cardiolipin synthase
MIEFVTLHFFTFITFLLVFAAIGHLLTQRKKPSSTIAWTLTLILLPYLGILLYMIFQDRKLNKIIQNMHEIKLQESDFAVDVANSKTEHLLRANGMASATGNNRFTLCVDGVDAYEKLCQLLEEAEQSIYISTYIFGRDVVTKHILKILTQKAKEGLEVKLLIDAFGSQILEIFPQSLVRFQEAGGRYHFFMSMLKHPMQSKLNLRNHRKMIVVDGTKVMSGGINISQEYLGSLDSEGLWMDVSFVLEGAAARVYDEIFRYNWESELQTQLKTYHDRQNVVLGDAIVQVVPSGPDVDRDALYEAYLSAIYEAEEKIWIVTPYFAPDSSLMDALIVARHRGVQIKIITPKVSDSFLVDISRSGFLRDLEKEQVEILFFKDKMMHAKAFLIDQKCAVLGSSNFDARSFFYNFEVVSFLYSKEEIAKVEAWIERLFPACELGIKAGGRMRILVENFFKILAPAL